MPIAGLRSRLRPLPCGCRIREIVFDLLLVLRGSEAGGRIAMAVVGMEERSVGDRAGKHPHRAAFNRVDVPSIVKTGPVVDGKMMPLASCHRHNLVETLLRIEYAWP